MDQVHITSTSNHSAIVSELVLRQTETTQLVFQSTVVDNPNDANAAVRGEFIFKRKNPNGAWEVFANKGMNTLRSGEEYKLPLYTAETRKLFDWLTGLYRIHKEDGIPWGRTSYIRSVREGMLALVDLSDDDLDQFLAANTSMGSALVARLLRWASSATSVSELVNVLEDLDPDALSTLTSAVNLQALKSSLDIWTSSHDVDHEEFWHKCLSERSFLFQQLFSWPCTIIEDKAYIGGKNYHNREGNIVDFLVGNKLTSSAALIEIKTPVTRLLGSNYRSGIPNISTELPGAIVQVLSYKDSLVKYSQSLDLKRVNVFDPPCMVIIGNSTELKTSEQQRTFELFRRQLKNGVEVVTFDELFERLGKVIDLIEGDSTPEEDSVEELPW